MGGIRFKENPDGPFLSDDRDTAAPPWATLRTLEEASKNFENDETGIPEKWLNQLIKPGSSLGGARPKADLEELWKRILFNMAVSNTDDHLRNHAFILTNTGWTLSPLYDVNPVPYGDELSLNVDEEDNRISLELILKTAPRFGISGIEAGEYADEFIRTVQENWCDLAKQHGLSRAQIEDMRPAFSFANL